MKVDLSVGNLELYSLDMCRKLKKKNSSSHQEIDDIQENEKSLNEVRKSIKQSK